MHAIDVQLSNFLTSLSALLNENSAPEHISPQLSALVRTHLPKVNFLLDIRFRSGYELVLHIRNHVGTATQKFVREMPLPLVNGSSGQLTVESFSGGPSVAQWFVAQETVAQMLTAYVERESLRQLNLELAGQHLEASTQLEERKLLARASGRIALWLNVPLAEAEAWLRQEASRTQLGLREFARRFLLITKSQSNSSQDENPHRAVAA